MSSPAVAVEGLVREFKGGIRAVDGLDLEVAEGEIYGFLGPNGAGKTTTVRILTTLLRPSSGSARVAGYDVVSDADKVRQSIGVALQEAAIDPLMTGRELLLMQGALHGFKKPEARERGAVLLERVGLVEAADRRVGGYSGGMRRRLDLALALVHRPEVLFLDEPTTGLDITSRTALWREVRALNDEGTTVFLTTQYLEEAEQLADRVGIIARGTLVAEGTPAELKRHVGAPTVQVHVSDEDAARAALASLGEVQRPEAGVLAIEAPDGNGSLAPVVRVLDEAGVEVESIEVLSPTLDDVFLAVTGSHLEGDDDDQSGGQAA